MKKYCKAYDVLKNKNKYGFQKLDLYKKREGYIGIKNGDISNNDEELQNKFLSYLDEHDNIRRTVFMIEPFPYDHYELTKFNIDEKIVALQVKFDDVVEFFNELADRERLDAMKKEYEIAKKNHDAIEERTEIFEQKENKISEFEQIITELRKKLKRQLQKNSKLLEQGTKKTMRLLNYRNTLKNFKINIMN